MIGVTDVICHLPSSLCAGRAVSGYIQALLDGAELSCTHYAFDRSSRKVALVRFLTPRQETSDSCIKLNGGRIRSGSRS